MARHADYVKRQIDAFNERAKALSKESGQARRVVDSALRPCRSLA
jgi:hypothetical protein